MSTNFLIKNSIKMHCYFKAWFAKYSQTLHKWKSFRKSVLEYDTKWRKFDITTRFRIWLHPKFKIKFNLHAALKEIRNFVCHWSQRINTFSEHFSKSTLISKTFSFHNTISIVRLYIFHVYFYLSSSTQKKNRVSNFKAKTTFHRPMSIRRNNE